MNCHSFVKSIQPDLIAVIVAKRSTFQNSSVQFKKNLFPFYEQHFYILYSVHCTAHSMERKFCLNWRTVLKSWILSKKRAQIGNKRSRKQNRIWKNGKHFVLQLPNMWKDDILPSLINHSSALGPNKAFTQDKSGEIVSRKEYCTNLDGIVIERLHPPSPLPPNQNWNILEDATQKKIRFL